MRIIDVSTYNGAIAWHKVAKKCDGAIIRAGYRGYGSGKLVTDSKFKANINAASAAGVPIGVYFVTQAITEAEAKKEARYTMDLIKGYNITLPIFIDSEDGNNGAGRADNGRLSKAKRTSVLKAFCEEIEKKGYIAGVYASEYWFKTLIDVSKLSKYYIWVAKYSTKAPSINYNAWQYTSKGKIDGIIGSVDISDFKPVKAAGKSDDEVAEEVLAGKYGDGEERKKALEAAGYNYKVIQSLVNEKLKNNAYYTVKAGDTLSSIAANNNTSVTKLVELNNLIYAGQKLKVRG